MPHRPHPADREDWRTPRWVLDWALPRWRLEIDAAASPTNAVLPRYWTREIDALRQDWSGQRIWCNPPYNRAALEEFVGRGWDADVAVYLVPVKSDQVWWRRYVSGRAEIWWILGRVRCGAVPTAIPIPCAVLVLGAEARQGTQQTLADPRSRKPADLAQQRWIL